MKDELKIVGFPVHIPNLDGDGVQEIVTIQIPVSVDPKTGEEMITPEALEKIEETKARYMGLLTPAQIKTLRQNLGLTQKEIAELLQAGEKSWTRWESGKARPSRMINLLLRLLYCGRLSVQDLRMTANEPPPVLPSTQRLAAVG